MEFVKKGTYTYKTDRCEVVVNVPRTIHMSEVLPAFEQFALNAARDKRKEKACRTAS